MGKVGGVSLCTVPKLECSVQTSISLDLEVNVLTLERFPFAHFFVDYMHSLEISAHLEVYPSSCSPASLAMVGELHGPHPVELSHFN